MQSGSFSSIIIVSMLVHTYINLHLTVPFRALIHLNLTSFDHTTPPFVLFHLVTLQTVTWFPLYP